MTIRLGVVMDPIQAIHYKKDSTLAMLFEAARRGFELFYFEQQDLFLRDGVPYGRAKKLRVFQDETKWFEFDSVITMPLAELNILLMRKDPPFNENYIYTTYLLELAEKQGVLVANRPQSLRDCNEKLFAALFPDCCPPTLVTQSSEKLHEFVQEQHDIVCKPLNVMGGASVFRLKMGDANANVIFETLTENGSTFIMAQKYIPEITQGDKRILLINGEPIPHVLARVPQGKDWRGNLAAGAKGHVQPLSQRDQFICAQLKSELQARGLYFVGIDIIGDYLTEINVTSPTGIREIESVAGINISGQLFDTLLSK